MIRKANGRVPACVTPRSGSRHNCVAVEIAKYMYSGCEAYLDFHGYAYDVEVFSTTSVRLSGVTNPTTSSRSGRCGFGCVRHGKCAAGG